MAIYDTARWNNNKPALMSYMITKGRMMRRKTGRKNATFIYMVSVVFALSIWTAFFFPSSDLLDSQAPVMVDPLALAPAKPGRTKICFVNSVFGTNSHKAMDQPQNVTSLQLENPDYRFYYFTNMEEIVTPGWTKVIMKDLKYQRHITMSRYPKFLGWKYQPIQNECGLVVYLDGYWKPRPLKTVKFRMLLRDLQVHKYGLFQVSHPFGNGLKAEFERIVSGTKDTQEHVDLSLKWLEAQPDFDDNCTLYWNGVFAYDPTNAWYQNASTFFWNRYSLELESWRDQPFWAYTLHHFGIEPMEIEEKRLRYFVKEVLEAKGDHHYNDTTISKAT